MKRTLLYILIGIAIAVGFLEFANFIYQRGVEHGYRATIDELIGNVREMDMERRGNAAVAAMWMFNKTDYEM